MKKLFTIFLSVLLISSFTLLLNGQHNHHGSNDGNNQNKADGEKDFTICPVGKMKIPKGKGITFVFNNYEFTVGMKGCEAEIKKNFAKYKKFGKEIKKQAEEIICPVTKTKIEKDSGIKFVHNNKEFIVCCDGCIYEIKKDFAKYEKFGKDVK